MVILVFFNVLKIAKPPTMGQKGLYVPTEYNITLKFLKSFYQFALKQCFFGKFSDLKKKKKKRKKSQKNPYISSRDVKLHNLGPNLARIDNFSQKRIFWSI